MSDDLSRPSMPSGAPVPGDRIAEFTAFRQRMNERILAEDNQVVRRFFALDTQTYKDGALDVKTREMLGLVASLVCAATIASAITWRSARRPESARRIFRGVQCRSRRRRIDCDSASAPGRGFSRQAGRVVAAHSRARTTRPSPQPSRRKRDYRPWCKTRPSPQPLSRWERGLSQSAAPSASSPRL
jgi:hypothetical protein